MESIRNVGVHDIRLTIEELPLHRSIILNFLHVASTSLSGSYFATSAAHTPLQQWESTAQTKFSNWWTNFDAGDQDIMCKRGEVG